MDTAELIIALLVGWCATPLIRDWSGPKPKDDSRAWTERLTGVFGGAIGAAAVYGSTLQDLFAAVVGAWLGATIAVEMTRLGVHLSRRDEGVNARLARRLAGVAAIASGFHLATRTLVFVGGERLGMFDYIDYVADSPVRSMYAQTDGIFPYTLVIGFAGIWWVSRRGLEAAGHGGFAVMTMALFVIAMEPLYWGDTGVALYGGLSAGLAMAALGLLVSTEMPPLAVSGLCAGALVQWGAVAIYEDHVPFFFRLIAGFLIGAAILWMGWEVVRRKAEGVAA